MAMLMTKKTLTKFGTKLNESAGSNVSDFARRQMEKFGWSEGKGLGKNEDGIAGHIKAKKREESAGLGSETVAVEVAADDWWHHGFTNALKKVPSDKSKKKKKKSKDKLKTRNAALDAKPPTFDELFAATGGKRLGMRARGSQKGKLARTLDGGNVESVVVNGVATGAEVAEKDQVNETRQSANEEEGLPAKKGKSKKKRKEKDMEEGEQQMEEARSRKKSKKSSK
mmetsp:Transcript_9022/g.16933  ORF Transcript_9022/g.16933 Transcript_9022/m.16933 type:complete len:226 (-) Transcript_9022:106-783(-)|eukprot:CAMPEP_0114433394 /NCGR_PEP_ID=MMETSP0103-20121206/11670_1 /TAXON_ID=37642 ORGANISM="Paraphysomonas imperforata, Strain PA2" /NCGR_SAMPLE_ID=MMETSP0103 /ASSEMBLY_ACC=CAM_ASM_000201 /LENGTH=225 /DNA_ID=CAMNT_0001603143 /DNA_START=161 /DNA_END=838 /DNA_ORIENTATION=+